MTGFEPDVVERLIAEEQARFLAGHPRSAEMFAAGRQSFLYGTPMHWMRRWAGGFPPYVERAEGTRLWDVDGNEYVDFCLGDSGAMCGHGNPDIADAVRHQMLNGATMMLPTEDSLWLGAELQRRFGLPYWNLNVSATQANRDVVRISRMITGRDKVLVFNGCYHGAVDEAFQAIHDGKRGLRNNIHGNAVDYERVGKVVEFNDLDAVEAALQPGDVACVLAEPFMSNCGMVPPDEGFNEALRELTARTGTLLIWDETHTVSSGIGGYCGKHDLTPDILVVGKAIGGGVPVAVYGFSADIAERVWTELPALNPAVKQSANAGLGGTLAGNALTVAAVRAAFEHALNDQGYATMADVSARIAGDVQSAIDGAGVPWHVTNLGGRVEYMFSPNAPRNGTEALAARDNGMEVLLHAYFLNEGILLTPFHNMVLTCPASSDDDVAAHDRVFRSFLDWLEEKGARSP